MSSSGSIVLNYGDYLVRESELKILRGEDWLNDVLIGFYLEYLRTEVHSEDCPGEIKMKFFGPEVTQCIKLSIISDAEVLFGNVEAASKFSFMFWPLNNSDNPNQFSGGTHWSLLVYSRPENIFAHFDSSSGLNNEQADALYQKLSKLITPKASLQHRGCEIQENSYDCGLHTICNAQIISDYVIKSGGLNGVHTAKASIASNMRKNLLELIEDLASKTK